RWRDRLKQQHVGDCLLVQRDAERGNLVAEGRIEPAFDLRVPLRLDGIETERQRAELPHLTTDGTCAVENETIAIEWWVAGLPPRGAQLELVEPSHRLDEPVRRCCLGIDEVLLRVPVHTGAIAADAEGQEQ